MDARCGSWFDNDLLDDPASWAGVTQKTYRARVILDASPTVFEAFRQQLVGWYDSSMYSVTAHLVVQGPNANPQLLGSILAMEITILQR